MIPDIKKNTELLQRELHNLQTLNGKLSQENSKLRGKLDDQLAHYIEENLTIKEAYNAQVASAKIQNEEQKCQIDKLSLQLNLKSQECLLQQEAVEEGRTIIEELKREATEQNISFNELREKFENLAQAGELEAARNAAAEKRIAQLVQELNL
jgi:hypothetical protein